MAGQATASPVTGIQSLILHGVGDWGNVPDANRLGLRGGSLISRSHRFVFVTLVCPPPTVLGAKILLEPDAGLQHPSRFFRCPLSLPGDTTPGGETEAACCTNCCRSRRTRLGPRILGN